MGCYDRYLVGISRRQVRVDEDKNIREGSRERERRGQVRPGVWIGIENNG